MTPFKKVIVVGLDGLDPRIVTSLLDAGELPNLAALRAQGGFARLETTYPAQTPVAWSTFATGTNPGGHGIFDFLRRDPSTYLPDLALARYEQKNSFVPPKAVNLRRGTAVWELISAAGVASTVLRCPCTYPPDHLRGRMLSGMGVPDLRGGLGTSTFYTSAAGELAPKESETIVRVQVEGGVVRSHVIGPRNVRGGEDARAGFTLELNSDGERASLRSDGQPRVLELSRGAWTDWLRLKFKVGALQSVRGMVRFYLAAGKPELELYASPVNFDPDAPVFPISSPWDYAAELRRKVGDYHTIGMAEDHTGFGNGRFDELAFLAQCDEVMAERERMLMFELERMNEGLCYCLFDTPDRIQHMFWRFGEPEHPANGGEPVREEYRQVIRNHYRRCDEIVGRALACAGPDTLVIVLSDHGFSSFQRGMHLNSWLHEQGFLRLRDGVEPGAEAGEFLKHVDWGRTRAYALGLGSIYLNLKGRERDGIVDAAEAAHVKRDLVRGLTGLVDPERRAVAVRGVVAREEVYAGPYAEESPDLLVCFAEGYRVSWSTALGGVPRGQFEDNTRRWSGDHIIDPTLVPGVLFMNRPFLGSGAGLVDLAPTILAALGIPRGLAMEGRSLLPEPELQASK